MQHHIRWYMLIFILVLLAVALPTLNRSHAAGERCFGETGQCMSGRFRTFWEQHGGLPVFGYPITPAREEVNAETGQIHLTQWFERARFELHPQNAPPYDVLLGRLGVDVLNEKGINWWSFPSGQPNDGCLYFESTQHTLCEPFLSNWLLRGLEIDGQPGKSYEESLALLGAPLSEPRWEIHGGANASVRLTQWFERARFELDVDQNFMTMGLLGVELYALRTPVLPAPPAPAPGPTEPGAAPEPRPTELTAVPGQPQTTATPTSTVPANQTATVTVTATDQPDTQDDDGTPTATVTATVEDDVTPSPTITTTPSPSPTLPPRSLNNCQDDRYKASAANFPIDIVRVDKDDQVVRLRNVSDDVVNLDDWTMCSIRSGEVHDGIGGDIDPDETLDFDYTGRGEIWDDDRNNNGALYNEDGQLVSYWFDPD